MSAHLMPVNTTKKSPYFSAVVLPLLGLVVIILLIMSAIHYTISWYNKPAATIPATTAKKITTITATDLYDLSGSEASGYSNPFKLFDEDCDPATNPEKIPATNPLPSSKVFIFYPQGKGHRIVIDLKAMHHIDALYWYDKAFESDSIWLYTGTMKNWKQAVAYKTGSPATWGWKQFTINSDTRYLMIRFNSYKSVISEMVLYGNAKEALQNKAAVKGISTPPVRFEKFVGVNSYDYPSLALMQPMHRIRLYQMMGWYDNDKTAYPANKTNFNHDYKPQSQLLETYADSLQKAGKQIWISVRGVPKYLEAQAVQEKDKPVTQIGMDTEDPFSYARHAKTFYNLAAYYSKSTMPGSSLQAINHNNKASLNVMTTFENGNEEDAYWTNNYWTPMDYFALSTADYDGHEGRMGKQLGIKNASPNSLLITSGMIKLDTQRTRTLLFLCQQLRTDQQFIWQGGVQYHHYSNDEKDNSKPPTKGTSPEEDKLRERLTKVKTFHNKWFPGIPVILGENGYDRHRSSWQAAPLLPGYNEEQSQGIMVIRSVMAAFASGIDEYIYYMMRNATNNDDASGTFATSGFIGGPQSNRIYQSWYYVSTVMQHLKNYQPDAVVKESGDVWIYRFRHQQYKDSVAYYMVCPTTSGNKINNYKLYCKTAGGKAIKQVNLRDNNTAGTVTTIKSGNGFFETTVSENPVFVFLKENK